MILARVKNKGRLVTVHMEQVIINCATKSVRRSSLSTAEWTLYRNGPTTHNAQPTDKRHFLSLSLALSLFFTHHQHTQHTTNSNSLIPTLTSTLPPIHPPTLF